MRFQFQDYVQHRFQERNRHDTWTVQKNTSTIGSLWSERTTRSSKNPCFASIILQIQNYPLMQKQVLGILLCLISMQVQAQQDSIMNHYFKQEVIQFMDSIF